MEITSIHTSKGHALRRYQLLSGISFEDVYAIGDGENDISQFFIATTAIAMKNATTAIQSVAHFVTTTNDESGVAYAIRHLLHLL